MNVTEILMREHQFILRTLDFLEEKIKAGPSCESARDLRKGLQFVREYADAIHHGKEEDCLFPALQRAGMPQQGPVDVMLDEHQDGRAYVRKASGHLQEYLENGAGWDMAVDATESYVQLLRSHIGKEDKVLFQLAERLLTDAQKELLVQQYASADDSVGATTIAEWEAWVDQAQPATQEPSVGPSGPGCLAFMDPDADLFDVFQKAKNE